MPLAYPYTQELIPLIIRKQTKAEIVLLNRGSLQAEVLEGDIQRMQDRSQNQVNFDFRANYKTIAKGVQLQSELKIFPMVINTVSIGRLFKDYIASFSNTAKFPLNKYLFLSTSAIFYQETQIGTWAHNAQIAIQLHQTWGKKP